MSGHAWLAVTGAMKLTIRQPRRRAQERRRLSTQPRPTTNRRHNGQPASQGGLQKQESRARWPAVSLVFVYAATPVVTPTAAQTACVRRKTCWLGVWRVASRRSPHAFGACGRGACAQMAGGADGVDGVSLCRPRAGPSGVHGRCRHVSCCCRCCLHRGS